MLSVLIPVYNYNVLPLVSELVKQCNSCGINFEILCQDDASGSVLNKENEQINNLQYCSFVSLETNIGLSSNRNLLASKAQYENLLFIDGDSIVIYPNYIRNYLNNIKEWDIVYGGRIHPENVLSDKQKLRWKYGRLIEDKTVFQRNVALYKTLMFNNTLIKKDCFKKIRFDANLTQYGHEDTLFAYQASLSHLKVKHIDNVIEHGDIDESKIYISKVKSSLKNLLILDHKKQIDPDFIKILKAFHLLKRLKLHYPVKWFFEIFHKIIYNQLNSKTPSLLLLNLYKLGYLCTLKG